MAFDPDSITRGFDIGSSIGKAYKKKTAYPDGFVGPKDPKAKYGGKGTFTRKIVDMSQSAFHKAQRKLGVEP